MSHGHTLVAVALALGAAGSFAMSNVTQMGAVARQPAAPAGRRSMDAGMLLRVARDPLWMVGLVASVVGFGLEAAALSLAPVVLVQPFIVSELAFAIPLAALLAGRRLGPTEWIGIASVTVGLAVIVAVIRPSDAPIAASAGVWLLLFATVGVVVAVAVAVAPRARSIARTSLYAGAAGATFGLLSVITKATTHQFAARGLGAIGTWQPWALAGVGLVGMTLAQNAYQAGPLAVSLPLLDLGEPVAASVIAVGAFGEGLGPIGTLAAGLLVTSVVAIGAGIALLDRSPLVDADLPPVTNIATASGPSLW